MNSLAWPKMFSGNSTYINETNKDELKASQTCIHLLLSSEKGELFGDPDFGIRLKRYVFDQNNYILKNVLIDEIYTQLNIFCPQLYIDRHNIDIIQQDNQLYCRITAKAKKDYVTNTYNLVLMSEIDE